MNYFSSLITTAERHQLHSDDVNAYLQEIAGGALYGEGFPYLGGDGAGQRDAAAAGAFRDGEGSEEECR